MKIEDEADAFYEKLKTCAVKIHDAFPAGSSDAHKLTKDMISSLNELDDILWCIKNS